MTEISNMDDVIDSRDIIARIEELESEIESAALPDNEIGGPNDTMSDERGELVTLTAFMDEMKGYGGDEQWRGDWYPVTIIRDSYFEDYAQELAEDIGAIKRDMQWPYGCIDWERAARELRMDYTSGEFDGVTYWYR